MEFVCDVAQVEDTAGDMFDGVGGVLFGGVRVDERVDGAGLALLQFVGSTVRDDSDISLRTL